MFVTDHRPPRLSPSSTGRSGRKSNRITLPDIPEAQRNNEGISGRSGARPADPRRQDPLEHQQGQQRRLRVPVVGHAAYLGEVKVGLVPDWLTATPDGKKMYVANAHDNTVSIIDVAGRKEITRIKVGQIPKRNITAIIPIVPTTNQ